MHMGTRAGCALVLGFTTLLTHGVTAPAMTFEEIGHDFVGGVGFINGNVRAAIAENGDVIFAGTSTPTGAAMLFVGDGVNPLSTINYIAAGYDNIAAPQIDAAGNVAFVATRPTTPNDFRGVYRTDTTGSAYSTVFEAEVTIFPTPTPVPQPRLAMSGNGTIAFSNVVSATGAIWTAPAGGPAAVLRQSTGVFFNNQAFDVNDSGTTAVQMEYTDPNNGLSRGILVFDTPGDDLSSIETTMERVGVGVQPKLAINNLGQVAFALNNDITINYFNPPLPGGGAPAGSQTLTKGIYIATPSAYGTPFTYTQIADTTGAFESFNEIRFNDNGTVVFEATFEVSPGNTEFGLFTGGDPVNDLLVRTGVNTVINGQNNFFSVIRMGDLNHQDQLTFQTSDFNTTDQIVWRVNNVPEPGTLLLLLTACACMTKRKN